MIKNIYKIKLTTFSFSILLLAIFLLFQTTFGETLDKKTDKFEGVWKQVGYGRIVEVKGDKVKTYDISKVSCVLTDEEKLGNIGNVKEITKNKAIIKNGINNMEFKRLKKLPKLCSQNTAKKNDPLFNFDSLWHTFNEHYAYFKTRNIDWDAYYKKYRSRLSSNSTEMEFYEVVKEMLDSIGDGHINFKAPSKVRKAYTEKHKTTAKKEMSDVERILTSQKLTDAIAKKYAKNIKTYNSGVLRWGMIDDDTAYLQINFMFLMSKQKSIPDNTPFIEFIQKYFQIIEEKPEQVFAEAIGASKAIKTVLNDTKNAKAFIIDIRFNPGGTDGVPLAFLSHFTDSRKKVFTKKARLGNGFTKSQEIFVNPATPQFTGNVYLLTSHQSASGAEIMSISTTVFPNIKRIGSNTEGIFSDILEKKLPNGWEYSLSNEVYLDTKGIDYENKGIPPHYKIEYAKEPKAFFEQMAKAVQDGDEAIETALKLIKGDETSMNTENKTTAKSVDNSPVKLDGQWDIVADAQGQSASLTFEFKQNGTEFVGTISTPYGDGLITDGKIIGDAIEAKVSLNAQGTNLKWNLRAKIEKDKIEGSMKGNGAPSVVFSGKKSRQETFAKYSGMWLPEKNTSKLPEGVKSFTPPMKISFNMKALQVKMIRTLSKETSENNYLELLPNGYSCSLDGTETTTKINNNLETTIISGTTKLKCSVNKDGTLTLKRLTKILSETPDGMNSTEAITKTESIWSVSNDGDFLTIQTKVESNRNNIPWKNIQIYKKK